MKLLVRNSGVPFVVLWLAMLVSSAHAQNPCTRVGQEICQQGAVYRCEKTGSEIAPIFQNRKCTVSAQSLVGSWRGMGHQTPAGAGGADYLVVMVIASESGNASIDYPSLSCGGTLTRLSGSATTAQYRENIAYGGNRCTNGGTVTVNLRNGVLAWTWFGVDRGKQYNVIAVLERR